MLVKKYNCETRKYEDYNIPDHWNTPLMSNNMKLLINCANCGRLIELGKGYVSRKIHNELGFGYSVCDKCYAKECEEFKKYVKNKY